jgi:hypothetical protein
MARVVVLGGGIAGHTVALKRFFGFQRGVPGDRGHPEIGEGASGLWCEPTTKKHLRPVPP